MRFLSLIMTPWTDKFSPYSWTGASRGSFSSLLKDFSQGVVDGLWRVVFVEKQRHSPGAFRITGNPTVFVCKAPGLESSAAASFQTGFRDKPINLSLLAQVRLV